MFSGSSAPNRSASRFIASNDSVNSAENATMLTAPAATALTGTSRPSRPKGLPALQRVPSGVKRRVRGRLRDALGGDEHREVRGLHVADRGLIGAVRLLEQDLLG